MMSTKHADGPWVDGDDGYVCDRNGRIVCECDFRNEREQKKADAARIVACVNGCEGYNPFAIFMLADAMKRIVAVADGKAKCSLDGYALDMLAIATEALAKAAT